MRTLLITCLCTLAAGTAAAQQHQHAHEHRAGHLPPGQLPDGWRVRVDRDQPATDIVFHAMDDHFHARTGPAAVFYRDDWTHTGDYSISARFRQNRAPEHPESYGLVIGGSDLDAAGQAYTYFLVRGGGEFFIARRDGAERTVVVPWTRHEAVAPQDPESGVQSNVLGIEVRGDEVVFAVNGTEVARRPRGELHTEGIAGFRINHRLDVRVDQLHR